MTDDHHDSNGHDSDGMIAPLLTELGLSDTMIGNLDMIAKTLNGFQQETRQRIAPTAGVMLGTLGRIPMLLERIDDNISDLQSLEQTLTLKIDAVHADLAARIAALQEQVGPARLRVGNR